MIASPFANMNENSRLKTEQYIRWSYSEIEQLCLKAARGAGMSWGLAEEAGFASAWLFRRGLDGPGALFAHIQRAVSDGFSGRWRDLSPCVTGDGFLPADDSADGLINTFLCPIVLGATLCDYARLPQMTMADNKVRIGPVSSPILLLPFLSDVARVKNENICFAWAQGSVVTTPDGQILGDVGRLEKGVMLRAELSAQKIPASQCKNIDIMTAFLVPQATINGLNDFALRVTVPASEASRAGAGAASDDNN